jgi:uncharacterized integral membrane protein
MTSLLEKLLPPPRKEDSQEPQDDWGINFTFACISIGVIAIIVISLCLKTKNEVHYPFWSNLGLFVCVALAAMLVGGFMGFLFGIPRSVQNNDNNPLTGTRDNTNLEQISDWLTKIIIGVSLTQIQEIRKNFDTITLNLVKGFSPNSQLIAYPFVSGLIIFSAIAGFMIIYIWSRMYLQIKLKQIGDVMKRVAETIQEKVDKMSVELEITSLKNTKTKFNRQRTRTLDAETATPEFKSVVDLVKPGAITVIDDSQKFRWGGKPNAGGYQLTATYEKNATGESFHVKLTVSPESPSGTLTGFVYFFLHDSYYPNSVGSVQATDNKAVMEIDAVEAFTVGAVCLDPQVKLELDMNTDDNAPEDLKYTDTLDTITALEARLKELEKMEE